MVTRTILNVENPILVVTHLNLWLRFAECAPARTLMLVSTMVWVPERLCRAGACVHFSMADC